LSESSRQPAAILALYRDITLMRRGPEELPVSWSLLLITMAAQVVLALVLGSILPQLPPRSGVEGHGLALLVIELVVPLLWGWGILLMAGRPERFQQMMAAAFGCQLVLLPLVVPAIWGSEYFSKGSILQLLAGAARMVLGVWITVATARIVRAATDWPMVACVVLVIIQGLVSLMILVALFPDAVEAMRQGA
jgi:hypothetical protein